MSLQQQSNLEKLFRSAKEKWRTNEKATTEQNTDHNKFNGKHNCNVNGMLTNRLESEHSPEKSTENHVDCVCWCWCWYCVLLCYLQRWFAPSINDEANWERERERDRKKRNHSDLFLLIRCEILRFVVFVW